MRRWRTAAAALAAGIAALAASVAVAAAGGGPDEGTRTDGTAGSGTAEAERRGGGPGRHATALAEELGVDADRLRAAMEKVREEVGPPPRPGSAGQRPSQQEREAHRNRVAAVLARELGLEEGRVRAALDEVGPPRGPCRGGHGGHRGESHPHRGDSHPHRGQRGQRRGQGGNEGSSADPMAPGPQLI